MRQILQSARTGSIRVAEVPVPRVLPGCVLVRVASSLVSAGTERASAEFASKSLLQKARARPDLVREVFNKARRDGVLGAFSAVRSRLDQPLPIGYSSAGTIVELGEGIRDLKVGDRVACAGANYAVHAEFACVPRLLVARIPSPVVDFDSAAFTTLGAVAIHGVRTADARFGDLVAVIGAGLLGQLTIRVLTAAGCRVVALDPINARVELAMASGAVAAACSEPDFRDLCLKYSSGNGVDSVLITAETASSRPANLASEIVRDRGVVVAVGTVGMELQRKHYYEKEIDFRVSRSYGPGRYDAAFEQKGRDYPIGYVRWTETRNMESFLQLLEDGKLKVSDLITHRFDIGNALAAYDLITGRSNETYLGILFRYPLGTDQHRKLEVAGPAVAPEPGSLRIGLLGLGNFALGTMLPAINQIRAELVGVCASDGARARAAADKFGFSFCTSNEDEILRDPTINTVVIAGRHQFHASQVLRALRAGKHVFCEKPLCLSESDLEQIREVYLSARNRHLMVGFNRRFSPMAREMKTFLRNARGPLMMHYRVNAGSLPLDHWINDPEQGGGRILGEVCHFVDFLAFLCGAAPMAVSACGFTSQEDQNAVAMIEFEDGSVGSIHYACNGDRSFGKERIEVFGSGCVAVLDDFRRLDLVRNGKKTVIRSRLRQDKGHLGEWRAFAEAVRTGAVEAPIPFEQIFASTLATIRLAESLRSGREQSIRPNEELIAAPLVS